MEKDEVKVGGEYNVRVVSCKPERVRVECVSWDGETAVVRRTKAPDSGSFIVPVDELKM